jgi:pSer/pThr/pTyr-binding forkhead associated (FHA) protein
MSAAEGGEAQPPAGLGLEVVAGNAAGLVIAVGARLEFGRQAEGPGGLADDPELSRRHAEITRGTGGEYLLEDLSSTNGTFVNGRRLEASTALTPGDLIDIGATRLIVRGTPADTGADEPSGPSAAESELAVAPPRLDLRLAVDLGRGEARITLGPDADPLALRLLDGRCGSPNPAPTDGGRALDQTAAVAISGRETPL